MAQMDTLRKAVRLNRVAVAGNCTNGRPGVYLCDGEVEDFMDIYNRMSGPEKAVNIYALLAFLASMRDMTTAWAFADVGVGIMCWLNLPVLALMAPKSFRLLKDYERQKKLGLDPVFEPADCGITQADLWKEITAEKYQDLLDAKHEAEARAKA